MKRTVILALAAVLLAVPCGAASPDGWTSKIPATQHIGPKYGDYLKRGFTPSPLPTRGPQKSRKKNSN